MENVKQKFYHQGFLTEVWSINKIQVSTKKEFYWMRALRTFYPNGLNKVTISNLFRAMHTFTVMFGSRSIRILSSVTAITFYIPLKYIKL